MSTTLDREAEERALARENRELARRLGALERQLEQPQRSAAQEAAVRAIEARVDEAAPWVGRRAPVPGEREAPEAYRLRALAELQPFSPMWKDRNLRALAPGVVTLAEEQILHETERAGREPGIMDGKLFRVTKKTERGMVTKTYGDPRLVWAPFQLGAVSGRFREPNESYEK